MLRCRLCDGALSKPFLDLGFTPPADSFVRAEDLNQPETHYPLRVVRCECCGFVQLDHVVDPSVLYQNDYPYESSMTKTGVSHFDGFAGQVFDDFNLCDEDLVIDVGSNVGVLLGGFKRRGCKVLGVDPAKNIAAIAEHNGIPTIGDFFSPTLADTIIEKHQKAKIITGSNVFAHIHDLDSMISAVQTLLVEDGVFIIEAPYLVHLIDNLEYDTIYHEHLSYISIKPLVTFFQKHGMEVFDVREMDIHGGSIRIFVGQKDGHPVQESVGKFVAFEDERDIHGMETLTAFGQRVADHRDELMKLLRSLKDEGKKIAGVSAPAKGMTLLNYCKIGTETLEFLTEKSMLKLGRYSPGGHIPVVSDDQLIAEDVDYALLLAWNFKDEIIKNLTEFREKGGKFIIPIPKPEIV
ncbi:class I SAM-dependent methyltransferase [Magnetovibrio sp. PR-2]|uniref:class I SAM-dependent methyltransferase n=1 Tax=Magnetovibrio sp. PR-2 TaxID=3120356 RepID=UPI002FCE28A5